jgi:hypothetical protein
VTGHSVDIDDGIAIQACTCNDCDTRWEALYRLAGYVRDADRWQDVDLEHFCRTRVVEEPETPREEPGIDADSDVFLAYWHQGKADGHWSSPNGCSIYCPMLTCQQQKGQPQ